MIPDGDKDITETVPDEATKTIVRYYFMGKGRGCVIRVAQIPAEQPTFPRPGIKKIRSIWHRIWTEIKCTFGYSDLRRIAKRHRKVSRNRTDNID